MIVTKVNSFLGYSTFIFADKERINFDFETLFETGVDEMSWDDTVS